ncbi:hypothetical protein AO367_0168 [Moraxella catarrhalis]|nr:hypothetical protein AO367_0168 [Moraxella catarrhalis]
MAMDARLFCQERQELIFNGCCMQVIRLLRKNPEGLSAPNIQKCVGMSYKTAMQVLAVAAIERDGKFYLK